MSSEAAAVFSEESSQTTISDEKESLLQGSQTQGSGQTQWPSQSIDVNSDKPPPVQFGPSWVTATPYMDPIICCLINMFLPGIGHVLLGQKSKGLGIFANRILLGIAAIFIPFIGQLISIFILVLFFFTLVDGIQIGERLERGVPVMKGECSNGFISMMLSCWVSPVFDNNEPASAPMEWRMKMKEIADRVKILNKIDATSGNRA